MHSTIALEPHSRPMRSTTSTAGRKDASPPPTAEALTSPRKPFSRSARKVAAGKEASASTAAACSAATAATDSSLSGLRSVPIALASEGAVEDQVHAAIYDVSVTGRVTGPVDELEPQGEVRVELPLDAGEPQLLLDVLVLVVAVAVVRPEGPVANLDLRARHQVVDVV